MSKISIEGNALGSGTFTIASPNSNTSRTLTLPDNTGTIVTTGTTTGIDASALSTGTVAKARLPAGSVLQVVEGSTDTQVVVSTVSYTDTGLTASITPSSASSKVLVIVSQQATLSRSSSNSEFNLDLQLLRGATVLEEYADYVLFANATGLISLGTQICITYLDSPNTTSSTTYKMQGRPDSTANSLTAVFQTGNRGRSSIILMEIAA
jgi:hypothetical protein